MSSVPGRRAGRFARERIGGAETPELRITVLEGDLRPFNGLLASLDSSLGLGQHDDNAPEGSETGIQSSSGEFVGRTDGERHYR
jgi:hypothetical protein